MFSAPVPLSRTFGGEWVGCNQGEWARQNRFHENRYDAEQGSEARPLLFHDSDGSLAGSLRGSHLCALKAALISFSACPDSSVRERNVFVQDSQMAVNG
jgi:hypothetical protein